MSENLTFKLASPKLASPEISAATDAEILAYLRRSRQIAKVAATTEQEALIMSACEQLGIVISEEELQAAGDNFRQQYKLFSASETLAWLAHQRITVEDWSSGIRVSLLSKKLKESLFGEAIDNHYTNNRDDYKRVALSQILVHDLQEAVKIIQLLREDNASFCALALEYSKAKDSKEHGGFIGIRFFQELMPEIAQVLTDSQEKKIIGPVKTKLGYHILRIEKWFPAQLSEIRDQLLESLFRGWLNSGSHSEFHNKVNKNSFIA
ncbi:peptidylprolyl isomerase [[Phormidium ambiguum] IAM M-71]|uniref:peptidylprolyl isomerase n=1 Tax=[Phormidium ambiguum] IAM M-71 TaxID=454136 RepID=A0A1U7ITQ5_9CYAN|nr:peptidylprolyl isomerase [Phormidium ambiguum]OKH40864.1 peptidylprolyl isomerase [Phormidium ambiguum IAM M-71]